LSLDLRRLTLETLDYDYPIVMRILTNEFVATYSVELVLGRIGGHNNDESRGAVVHTRRAGARGAIKAFSPF
jgi:hypothetical protein